MEASGTLGSQGWNDARAAPPSASHHDPATSWVWTSSQPYPDGAGEVFQVESKLLIAFFGGALILVFILSRTNLSRGWKIGLAIGVWLAAIAGYILMASFLYASGNWGS